MSQLMRNYYAELPDDERPRVLGLTVRVTRAQPLLLQAALNHALSH
jgi:hypothetical protein